MTIITSGEKILFDTNIFIYSALDHPKYGNPCTQLILEVESGKIEGYVPTIVLNELLHRLMIAEVIERGIALNTGDAIRILKNDKNTMIAISKKWNGLGLGNRDKHPYRHSMHESYLIDPSLCRTNRYFP